MLFTVDLGALGFLRRFRCAYCTKSPLTPTLIPSPFRGKNGKGAYFSGDDLSFIVEVIDCLNAATGKKITYQSKNNKHIIARKNEGHVLESFFHVIEVKSKQWKGDHKMDRMLKPSTLFIECHFEDYLNEKVIVEKKLSPTDRIKESILNNHKRNITEDYGL